MHNLKLPTAAQLWLSHALEIAVMMAAFTAAFNGYSVYLSGNHDLRSILQDIVLPIFLAILGKGLSTTILNNAQLPQAVKDSLSGTPQALQFLQDILGHVVAIRQAQPTVQPIVIHNNIPPMPAVPTPAPPVAIPVQVNPPIVSNASMVANTSGTAPVSMPQFVPPPITTVPTPPNISTLATLTDIPAMSGTQAYPPRDWRTTSLQAVNLQGETPAVTSGGQ